MLRSALFGRKAVGMTITDKGINIFAPASRITTTQNSAETDTINSPEEEEIYVAPKGANPQVPMKLGLPSTGKLFNKK